MNDNITITREQRQELAKRKVNLEVSLLEQELLLQLRELTHGKFTIQIIDSLPVRYEINVSRFFAGDTDFGILNKGGGNS